MHCDLPAAFIWADFYPQRPPDDLMSETHADNTDPILRKDFGGEIDQSVYPGYIIKGVMSCADSTP